MPQLYVACAPYFTACGMLITTAVVSFRPGRGAIDDLFILPRMQMEYQNRGEKLYMCVVDLDKAFY